MKKNTRFLLYISFGIAAVWIGFQYLLPILLPFLIGFLLSRAAEPVIQAVQKNSRLPRWVCAAGAMILIYGVLGTALFFLIRTLLGELQAFISGLPALLASLDEPMQALQLRLETLVSKLPDSIAVSLRQWISNLFESGSVIAEGLSGWLLRFASGTVSTLPGIFLFVITAVLSSFMLSSEWPFLRRALARRLPKPWQEKLAAFLTKLKSAMGGWLKAQLKLTLLCFVILTVGFWIMRVDYPLLFGAIIALVDALPVLGTGTVLIPWALIRFLQGDSTMGIGLLILYGASALTRTAMEPRLLGKQIGLPPVLTLFSMYAGYRLLGVFGMILLPIAAILAKQFLDLWEGRTAQ